MNHCLWRSCFDVPHYEMSTWFQRGDDSLELFESKIVMSINGNSTFTEENSWERDKTADFKRDKTAGFQNRTKQPVIGFIAKNFPCLTSPHIYSVIHKNGLIVYSGAIGLVFYLYSHCWYFNVAVEVPVCTPDLTGVLVSVYISQVSWFFFALADNLFLLPRLQIQIRRFYFVRILSSHLVYPVWFNSIVCIDHQHRSGSSSVYWCVSSMCDVTFFQYEIQLIGK